MVAEVLLPQNLLIVIKNMGKKELKKKFKRKIKKRKNLILKLILNLILKSKTYRKFK